MTTTLRLGHSPDPDDAFMFYGLAKGLLPTGRYRFQHILQDIQTLNQRAMKGELEITAISMHAYPYVSDKYILTSCGSSMGDKYGPMVITRQPTKLEDLRGKTIAIPGKLTTAFLALQLCLGKGVEKDSGEGSGFRVQENKEEEKRRKKESTTSSFIPHPSSLPPEPRTLNPEPSLNPEPLFFYEVVHFDEIPQYVKDGKADAGLIIHEGQLTYKTLDLHLVIDLGQWWFDKTGLPLPLGGNCIRRDLGRQTIQEVTDILKKSIQFSLDHRSAAVEYALQYGRDLNQKLADEFVGMYVNHWTLDYGPKGREAITRLLKEGARAGLVPDCGEIDYVTAK